MIFSLELLFTHVAGQADVRAQRNMLLTPEEGIRCALMVMRLLLSSWYDSLAEPSAFGNSTLLELFYNIVNLNHFMVCNCAH